MSHSHPHAHHDLPQDFGARFALGIGLNIAFVVIEAFHGWWTDMRLARGQRLV